MRTSLVIAAAVSLTAACTHRYPLRSGPPREQRNHAQGAVEGLGIGAVSGAALGAGIGLAMGNGECSTNEDTPGPCFASTRWHKAGVGALLGGASGGLLGLVLGGLAGSREVHGDPYAPRVIAAVAPGQASATASWSF